MGNNPSLHLDRVRRKSSTVAMVPPLAKEELELLVTQTGLSAEEVKKNYKRFCTSGYVANIITRQGFSEIMAKCFPRTYKVNLLMQERFKKSSSTQTNMIYIGRA